MFFGVGAYGVSLPRYSGGMNWSALVIGLIAAAALSLALALATWPFLALDAVDLLLHGNVGGHLALMFAVKRESAVERRLGRDSRRQKEAWVQAGSGARDDG